MSSCGGCNGFIYIIKNYWDWHERRNVSYEVYGKSIKGLEKRFDDELKSFVWKTLSWSWVLKNIEEIIRPSRLSKKEFNFR